MQPISVNKILKEKGNDVFSVTSKETSFEALQELAKKDTGALLVMDDGKLVGIFSERDYARKIIIKGKSSKETLVEEVMSTDIISTNSKSTLRECMKLMTENRIRHLPVIDDEKLVGVISIGDIVNCIMKAQANEIDQLSNYIKSAG